MIPLQSNINVDNSDLVNYPNGRIKDNQGAGEGTPVNRNVYGDLHANISRLMRLYNIAPTGLPDNETNGYQIIDSLIALASKNDYIYAMTTTGTELSIDIKISLMKENEFLVCRAAADKTLETTIKGSNGTAFAVTYSGNFKANEYVRVIKTNAGVSIIRVADWQSLNAMVSELLYLKKASQAEENAGTIDTVATTPLVNKVTFARRVNGADSSGYLASASQNGVYPKEHYSVVAALAANPIRNKGSFSGFDINGGSVGQTYSVSGDLLSATLTATGASGSTVTIVVANTMTNTSFLVKTFLQSISGNPYNDNGAFVPVFNPDSATSFSITFREGVGATQNYRVFVEVEKY